jgi:hypothetical protein
MSQRRILFRKPASAAAKILKARGGKINAVYTGHFQAHEATESTHSEDD